MGDPVVSDRKWFDLDSKRDVHVKYGVLSGDTFWGFNAGSVDFEFSQSLPS